MARRGFRRKRKVVFSIPFWSVVGIAETGWFRKRLLLTVATPDRVTRRVWLEVDDVRSWLATLRALVRGPPL